MKGEAQRLSLQLLAFWLLAAGVGGDVQRLSVDSIVLWTIATAGVLVVLHFADTRWQTASPEAESGESAVSFVQRAPLVWRLPDASFTSSDVGEAQRQDLKDKAMVCFTTPTTSGQKNSLLCLFPSTRMFDLENWGNKSSAELNMIRTCVQARSSGGAPVVVFNADTQEKQQFLTDVCPTAQMIQLNVGAAAQ